MTTFNERLDRAKEYLFRNYLVSHDTLDKVLDCLRDPEEKHQKLGYHDVAKFYEEKPKEWCPHLLNKGDGLKLYKGYDEFHILGQSNTEYFMFCPICGKPRP
jgi:hypothetical protein